MKCTKIRDNRIELTRYTTRNTMFTGELTKILLKRAFSLGGKGLLGGILFK